MRFLFSNAKIAFTQLKQTLIMVFTFHYFAYKYYIRIVINVFQYAIGRILS